MMSWAGYIARFSVVYPRDQLIAGAVLGVADEHFFTREKYAADLFLHVRPQFRRGLLGGLIATRLWRAFRAWAEAQVARQIRLGATTGISPARPTASIAPGASSHSDRSTVF
jgi:hypothetical protein